jgi:hypothetical protein
MTNPTTTIVTKISAMLLIIANEFIYSDECQ